MARKSHRLSKDIKRIGDLDIDEDLTSTRRLWKIQRGGQVVFAAILLFVVLGLFGSGVFSRVTEDNSTGAFSLDYERFAFFRTDDRWLVKISDDIARDGKLRLWISGDPLRKVRIHQITPEPIVQIAEGDRTVFEIMATAFPAEIAIHVEPEEAGVLRARIGVQGEPPVELKQFVWR